MTRQPDRDRLESWGTAAALVVLVGVAYQPSWHSGLAGEDFPGHVALLQRFLAGLDQWGWLPLWTSDWGSGSSLVLPYLHPIIALLALSPFTLLFGPELGLRVGDSCFLALASLTMLLWCRSLGASRLAAGLGGLCYAVHPMVFMFLGRGGQVHHPLSMAALPLVFLCFRRLAQAPDLGRLALASLATAALAVDMQRFWLVLPFVLLSYIATARDGPPMPAPRAGAALCARLCWVAAAGLGSALLLCFPVLPALLERPELMGHPQELLERYRQSFPIPHLLTLIDRDAALSGALEGISAARPGPAAGGTYQGAAPILLVLLGMLLALGHRQARALRAPLALVTAGGALALLLGMGPRALVSHHGSLLRELALAEVGIVPWLALLFVALGAVVALLLWLAAARDRWPEHRAAPGLAMLLGVGLLCSMAPFDWIAKLPLYAEVRAPAHFAFPLLPFVLGTAVSLVLRTVLDALPARLPVVAVAAGFALLHLLDLHPYRDLLRPTRTPEADAAMRSAFREIADTAPGRVLTSEDHAPLAEMLGLLEARRRAAWSWIAWSSSEHTGDLIRYGFFSPLRAARDGLGVEATEFAARTAGLAHVRYLARVEAESAAVPEDPVFLERVDAGGVQIYENLRTLAYAQFYPRLALVSGTTQEILGAMVQLAYAGVATVALGAGARPPGDLGFDYASGQLARVRAPEAAPFARAMKDPPEPAPFTSPCRADAGHEPELVLRCRFDTPGYLVVAESWSPRWQAWVDGRRRALYRMNLAFQGLRVSPQDREIRLRYTAPWTYRMSLAVSLLAWLALGGFGIRRLQRAWRPRGL